MIGAEVEISVLIPLEDVRGDAVDHLRTWTHGQSLPRDRYQVVLCSDGQDPEGDREVARLLEPHDVLAVEPGGGLMDLFNGAARSAGSPWLLVTEAHCEAGSKTLERMLEAIEADPDLEAARLEHGHVIPGEAGELGARWFDDVYEVWDAPGEWGRLDLAGILVRSELYQAVGGLHPDYGLFSQMLFAARLDERGARVGRVRDTGIQHIQPEHIDEHHGHTANFTLGECEARATLDPVYSERYFGHQHLLQNRRALDPRIARRTSPILAKEAARALLRPRDLPWLLRELRHSLPAAIGGPRPALLGSRLSVGLAELAMTLERLPRRLRYWQFGRGQEGVIRRTQLEWIEANGAPDDATIEAGSRTGIDRVPEHSLTGLHGLERDADRPFRWTEPVLVIGLPEREGAGRLRIDTAGPWPGAPARLVAAYLDRRRLDPTPQADEDGSLVIDLQPGGAAALTLLFRPAPTSSADRRRLGVPLFGLELQAS